MRIGIDARKIRDFGIGAYIQHLLRHIPASDAENTYVIIHYPQDRDLIPGHPNFACVADESPKYSVRELTALPVKMAQQRLDLFHAPHYTLPPVRPCRGVVTIHDVIHLRFRHYLPHPLAAYYAKTVMWLAARSAAKIITVSRCSQRDIARYLHIPEAKIIVIPNGIAPPDEAGRAATTAAAVKARFGVSRPYILYLGNFLPHKNIAMLITAYALFKQRYGLPHCLVLAGKNTKLRPQLERVIAAEQVTDDVVLTGFVEDEWVSPLYDHADLFVYPSLYEGFGLQALEAMARRVPVAASNVAALPEVVGEAGLLFDPADRAAIAHALHAALTDQALRQRLVAAGLERITQFSWQAMARRTVAVYQDVLRNR